MREEPLSERRLTELLFAIDPMCGWVDCEYTASKLWPIIEAALRSTGGWEAYRSQDAGGSPEAAENVGWRWIEGLANVEREDGAALLEIHSSPVDCDGRTITLYRGTRLLACATIFRDPMNFAVLVRWQAPAPPVSDTGERG